MKKLLINIKTRQHGSILLVFLLTLPFIIMTAIYFTSLSLTSYSVARLDMLHTEAQMAADAGADYAVQQFQADSTWTSTAGEMTLHTDSRLRTTFQASISGDNTAKVIAVTGKSYWPANSNTVARKVSIYVDLRPVSAGTFSVVSGEGGLYLSNNAKVLGGDVFVNGDVHLSNNSQIGLSTSPVTMNVADMICPVPADATYPRVCNLNEAGQPISITGNGNIYGTVKANNQTSGSKMSNPGLVAGTVTPQTLPTYNRNAQKSAVSTTYTPAQANCSGSNKNITWPANTKITGNITISNGCNITIMGNVWITGNLSLSNSGKMKVDNSLGSTVPVIMVDGSTGASISNNSQITPNSSSTGAEIITFWSNSACTPDCATVTGTALYNSRAVTTISIDNNSSASSSIFYAYWSQVSISNSGALGAVIGQTVSLSNNAAITFGTSVGVGSTTWVVKGYRKQ